MAYANKRELKYGLAWLLGNPLAFSITNSVMQYQFAPYIRCVTYHDTPVKWARMLERQFEWYSKKFVNCDRADLNRFLERGIWNHSVPGLIISFDDGLRSNLTVAAPLLKKYGFTGWFMVPSGVPGIAEGDQWEFAERVRITHSAESREQQLFLDWNDVRSLVAAGHQICCHSFHHVRLRESLNDAELKTEICRSKHVLERELGGSVDVFAWVGGEDYAFSRAAFEKMKECGYKLVFSTNCFPIATGETPLCLERNHVDASFSLNEVRLSIGGLYDLFYFRKRRRVRRLIGVEAATATT